MKKSLFVFLMVLLLGACSSEKEKVIFPSDNSSSLKPIMQKQDTIYGYKSVIYQVSTLKTDGYYTKQIDNSKKNGMDGYAGWLGKSIDCVKMYIG